MGIGSRVSSFSRALRCFFLFCFFSLLAKKALGISCVLISNSLKYHKFCYSYNTLEIGNRTSCRLIRSVVILELDSTQSYYHYRIYPQIGRTFFPKKMGPKLGLRPIRGYKRFDTSLICKRSHGRTLQNWRFNVRFQLLLIYNTYN